MEILETDENLNLNKLFIECVTKIIIVSILITVISIGFFNIAHVSGQSMTPTLQEHDILFINKITPRIHEPSQGDIVVIKFKVDGDYIVKRVIGTEGDIVEIINHKVFVNGSALDEDYLKEAYTLDFYADSPWVVPENEIFVLGDCRDSGNSMRSFDSRSFGTLPNDSIEGVVQYKLFPKVQSLIYK